MSDNREYSHIYDGTGIQLTADVTTEHAVNSPQSIAAIRDHIFWMLVVYDLTAMTAFGLMQWGRLSKGSLVKVYLNFYIYGCLSSVPYPFEAMMFSSLNLLLCWECPKGISSGPTDII